MCRLEWGIHETEYVWLQIISFPKFNFNRTSSSRSFLVFRFISIVPSTIDPDLTSTGRSNKNVACFQCVGVEKGEVESTTQFSTPLPWAILQSKDAHTPCTIAHVEAHNRTAPQKLRSSTEHFSKSHSFKFCKGEATSFGEIPLIWIF